MFAGSCAHAPAATSNANSPSAPVSKPASLYACLGKDFAYYDALLGKAEVRKREQVISEPGKFYTKEERAALPKGTREDRDYTVPSLGEVSVGQPPSAAVPTYVAISLRKHVTSWKQALAVLRIPVKGVKPSQEDGYVRLKGFKATDGKAWTAAFSAKGDIMGGYDLEITPEDSDADYGK